MMYFSKKTFIRFFASLIWNLSEFLKIPLGRFAPKIFGLMIGSKKYKRINNKPKQ